MIRPRSSSSVASNHHDRVGRGFNEHAAVNIYAEIAHNRFTLWPRHKIGRTHHVYDRFRPEGPGAVHPVFIQSYLFPHHLVCYRLRDVPEHLRRIAARILKATVCMGCQIEMKPVDANRVALSSTRRDAFGVPIAHLVFNYSPQDRRLLEEVRGLLHGWFDRLGATNRREMEVTWARHHIGACRMGTNPRTSVCNPDLRVHPCPNLYLAGCEVFPTGTGLPPVPTIAALAHRLGDHLVERFESGHAIATPAAKREREAELVLANAAL